MRIVQLWVGIGLLAVALVTLFPVPSWAASSAAVRAYDDVTITSKDFSGQILIQAQFNDAKLEGANFSHADLRGAVFNGSSLKNANFTGADLSDAIAYLSDFSNADFSDVVFTSAMLLKSRFRGAIVNGADFSYALLDRDQILQLCASAEGINSKTGVATRESLECRP